MRGLKRDELGAAFCHMFGVQEVYDFQVEVAYQLFTERKSVILQRLPGAGKPGPHSSHSFTPGKAGYPSHASACTPFRCAF